MATFTNLTKNTATFTNQSKSLTYTDFLLLENGTDLLLEDGTNLILENSIGIGTTFTNITKN